MKVEPRYEVQIRTKRWGWASALATWPARTKAEGLKSLDECATGLRGEGSAHDYRLVRLIPKVIAVRRARRNRPSPRDPTAVETRRR